jgi:hypothetical protein
MRTNLKMQKLRSQRKRVHGSFECNVLGAGVLETWFYDFKIVISCIKA